MVTKARPGLLAAELDGVPDGYYDPVPRFRLLRPLVLVGYPGARVRQVVRSMSGSTGLPFNDIERLAEGKRGQSRWLTASEEGFEAVVRSEEEALWQCLRRRPAGLVASPASLFSSPAVCEEVARCAAVLFLERPVEVLLGHLLQESEMRPQAELEWVPSLPGSPGELQALLDPLLHPSFAPDRVVDCGSLHPSRVADRLVEELGDATPDRANR